MMSARLTEFDPLPLSSLMWSAATLGQTLSPPLLQQIYRSTRPHLATFPVRQDGVCFTMAGPSIPHPDLCSSSTFTLSPCF